MGSKITVIEGNSNDKDQIRTYLVKGEKGDKGDTGPAGQDGQDGAYSKTSELTNDSGFITSEDVNDIIDQKLGNLDYFPVGSLYFTAVNTNPSTFLGGTWQRVAEGKFIVGVGQGTDTNGVQRDFVAGANDGEYEHIQTLNELATHTHSFSGSASYTKPNSTTSVNADIGSPRANAYTSTNSGTVSISGTSGSTGLNQGMNTVNPSFGMYVWQRTA